jgi:hypothetical protein
MAVHYPVDDLPEEGHEPGVPRRHVSGWLIALIVLLALSFACCLCLFLAGWLLGPAVGDVFTAILETAEAATPYP